MVDLALGPATLPNLQGLESNKNRREPVHPWFSFNYATTGLLVPERLEGS